MGGRRTKKIAEAIKKEISSVIVHELNDPRVGFITVTKVELSSDMRRAKVFVSVLDELTEKTSIHGLKNARSFIQSEVARRLNFRYTPILSFQVDETLKKMAHMNELMSELELGGDDDDHDDFDDELYKE